MKMMLLNKCLFVLLVASSCSGTATSQKNSPAAGAVSSPVAKNDLLDQRFAQIAAEAQGRVGFAARVLETGEETSLNPGEHFPMHSVYKLPIAMAVLRRVDAGELKLDQMVQVAKSDFVRQGLQSHSRSEPERHATHHRGTTSLRGCCERRHGERRAVASGRRAASGDDVLAGNQCVGH